MSTNEEKTIQLNPIGTVQNSGESFAVEIAAPYRPALKQLDQFSHVIVLWWADQNDNEQSRGLLQTRPFYAEEHLTGVFACRAEYRPNPIGSTVCKMLAVDEEAGLIRLEYIDAFDGTPVVDLKAYFPVSDRVKSARIPAWLSDWPEWVEEAYKLAF
jgi:tRNA-Thr(GGU) m(6)t(6)A37 methyltransferase TsaA